MQGLARDTDAASSTLPSRSLSLAPGDSLEREQYLLLGQLQSELDLRKAALEISNQVDPDTGMEQEWISDLKAMSSALDSSNDNRVWANHLRGTLYLRRNREGGDVSALWNYEPVDSHDLNEAQDCFTQTLTLLGSSLGVLKRSIMRSLALIIGPNSGCDSAEILTSGELILCSVGDALLQEMSGNETDLKDRLNAKLGKGWRVVLAALCPTGKLLFSSIDNSEDEEIIYNTA